MQIDISNVDYRRRYPRYYPDYGYPYQGRYYVDPVAIPPRGCNNNIYPTIQNNYYNPNAFIPSNTYLVDPFDNPYWNPYYNPNYNGIYIIPIHY